jgi:hypothetical protein
MSETALEYELLPPPTDGINAVKIFENKFLLATSWDTVIFQYQASKGLIFPSF